MAYEETRLSAIQEVKDRQRKESEKMKALEEENSKKKASGSVARKSTTARRPGTSQATSRMSGYQAPEDEQELSPKTLDSIKDEDLFSGRLTALRGLQKRDSATKATATFSTPLSTDDEDDLSSLFEGDLNVSTDEDEQQVEHTSDKTIFDIAPEQRTDIFEYYLITRAGIHIPAQPPYVREPALLAVSKQVRAEATPIWYSENTFVSRFTGDITRWLDSLDPAWLSMLTWVNLETTLPAGFVLPGLREMNKRVKDGLKESVVAVTVAVEKEETVDAHDQAIPHVDNLKGGRERYELVTMDDVWKYNNLDGGWKTLHTKPKSTLRNVTERDPGAEPMEGVKSTAAEENNEDDSDVDLDSDDEDLDDENSDSDDTTAPWEYVELTEEQYKNIRHIKQAAATENDHEKPRHATEDGNKKGQHLQAHYADKSFLPRESSELGEEVSQAPITATAPHAPSPISSKSSSFAPSPSSPKTSNAAASSPAPSGTSSSFAPSPSSLMAGSTAVPSLVSSKTISSPPRPPTEIQLNVGTVAPRASRGRRQSLTDDPTKIFGCDICGRRFRRTEHLRRHHKSLHTDDKPFECRVCQKAFSRSDNLTQHEVTHRKDSLGSLESGKAKSSGLLSEEMVFGDEDDDPVRTGTQRGRKAARD